MSSTFINPNISSTCICKVSIDNLEKVLLIFPYLESMFCLTLGFYWKVFLMTSYDILYEYRLLLSVLLARSRCGVRGCCDGDSSAVRENHDNFDAKFFTDTSY